MPRLCWLVPGLYAFGLSGCLSTFLGTKDSRNEAYHVPEPGPGWQSIDPGEADRAWRSSSDQSILNVSSICGESRYKPLESLAADILQQLPAHELLAEPRSLVIGGNPALITEARGAVDGKEVTVRLAVIRTHTCLFDFILAGQKLDSKSRLAFDSTLAGFQESRAR